jgi:hypothetical protein
MRKPPDITIDRALLIYLLQLVEPYGFMSDVKFQQLVFLSELHMLGKSLRGFHFEFMRFAYGAFSKDVDNDLLFLRRKERLENFSVTDQSQSVLELLEKASKESEANQQVIESLQDVIQLYGPQDNSDIMKSVEAIEISPAHDLQQKIAIGDISFHTIILVPSRIEITGEFTLSPLQVNQFNAALGY